MILLWFIFLLFKLSTSPFVFCSSIGIFRLQVTTYIYRMCCPIFGDVTWLFYYFLFQDLVSGMRNLSVSIPLYFHLYKTVSGPPHSISESVVRDLFGKLTVNANWSSYCCIRVCIIMYFEIFSVSFFRQQRYFEPFTVSGLFHPCKPTGQIQCLFKGHLVYFSSLFYSDRYSCVQIV